MKAGEKGRFRRVRRTCSHSRMLRGCRTLAEPQRADHPGLGTSRSRWTSYWDEESSTTRTATGNANQPNKIRRPRLICVPVQPHSILLNLSGSYEGLYSFAESV